MSEMPQGGPLLLTDEMLKRTLNAAECVEWMREAVVASENGRLTAPARAHTELRGGRLVFTTGALSGEWFGYRSYDTFGSDTGEQIVAVHSAVSGRVEAIAVGNLLGQIRTGALGGVAASTLAREDASRLGLIGAGRQAWTQVWAIAAVRPLRRVTVHSRTPAHAEHFARRVQRELGVQCEAVDSAEAAVKDHDIVVLATNSRTSVIDPHWLGPGTHVTTLGPKQTGAAEFNLDLVEAADIIVTDSLVQHRAYDPPSLVSGSRHDDRVAALGAVLTSSAPGRQSDPQVSLYLSVGLAGTEVHLLDRLAAKMRPLP